MIPDETKIIVAIIAALTSLAMTVINIFATRNNQRSLANFKADLEERKAKSDARRDYEYDARKRLYRECEPLFFLLNEFSENALRRIHSLARTARTGNLSGRSSWLSGENYYLVSTLYNLIAPLVIFKLIRHRLTLIDLSVDPRVKTRYDLIKHIYFSFTADFEFAAIVPKIEYHPNISEWKLKRVVEPEKYWRQGLPIGRLDNAVESLIVENPGNVLHCMSFGQFEHSFYQENSSIREAFSIVADIFVNFHPRTRPVLWRILVAQSHLYLALARVGSTADSRLIRTIPETERKEFEWRSSKEEASDQEVLVQPFEVSRIYFEDNLKQYLM